MTDIMTKPQHAKNRQRASTAKPSLLGKTHSHCTVFATTVRRHVLALSVTRIAEDFETRGAWQKSTEGVRCNSRSVNRRYPLGDGNETRAIATPANGT